MKWGGIFYGMNSLGLVLRWSVLQLVPLFMGLAVSAAQTTTHSAPTRSAVKKSGIVARKSYTPALVQSGGTLFRRDCSFCHGRDAGGGETGPDLTRSKLVAADVGGNKIGPVVRNGRPEKGM